LGRPLFATPPASDLPRLEADLAAARADLAANPNDPEKIIWVGRRLGYLWRMREAVDVYTEGLNRFPSHAPLYRHRGHRRISLRRFDEAIADLQRAAELIEGKPDDVEPDGQPNARNIPLTSTAFNVWYHLGVAHYLKGDDAKALEAFRNTLSHRRGYDDNLVAVTDWMYLCLRRLGRHEEAQALLAPIHANMDIIENSAYHRRLLLYKGWLTPDDLLGAPATGTDGATLAYGVAQWMLFTGREAEGAALMRKLVSGDLWPAFAFIAAEADLSRRGER
jgi:tetratricopeptide (TPR) repeat protein